MLSLTTNPVPIDDGYGAATLEVDEDFYLEIQLHPTHFNLYLNHRYRYKCCSISFYGKDAVLKCTSLFLRTLPVYIFAEWLYENKPTPGGFWPDPKPPAYYVEVADRNASGKYVYQRINSEKNT